MDSLQQILRQMTSVYDLRIIFNLGFQTLAPDEMHAVLIEAFGEIIREKLVFDDKAAVFFNMGLQECKRHSFLSEVELVEWDVKATKVNVENSDWVREIKQALQDVECRVATTERNVGMLHNQFDALRNALIEREQSQIKHRERQRYISLLSSALIMCGGGVIKDVFGAAFDLWDPEQLLSTLSAEHMTDFLAEKTNTLLFKRGVEALLVDAHVDPVEFAVVLRNAINLERIETMTPEETTASPGSDEEFENPLFSPKKINTFRAAVLAAVQAAKVKTDEEKPAPQSSSSSPPTFDSQMSEEDMAAYPYHYAVRFSEGDFDRFQEIVEYIELEGDEINETVNIHVRSADSGNQWKVVEASALVYASYLGHVDIVKWFLARDDVVKTEQKVLTIKRSRSSLTDGNEVCIKCLASGA